jgi:hypothetical protein
MAWRKAINVMKYQRRSGNTKYRSAQRLAAALAMAAIGQKKYRQTRKRIGNGGENLLAQSMAMAIEMKSGISISETVSSARKA